MWMEQSETKLKKNKTTAERKNLIIWKMAVSCKNFQAFKQNQTDRT